MERQRKKYRSDEKKIRSLFKELDVNNDGIVDVQELNDGLKRLGIPNIPGQAEVRCSCLWNVSDFSVCTTSNLKPIAWAVAMDTVHVYAGRIWRVTFILNVTQERVAYTCLSLI